MTPVNATKSLINRLVRESGAADAEMAIRQHARGLIERYRTEIGDVSMPLDMEVLASLRGISKSELPPTHSTDAELVPDGQGGVEYRVNPDRPETRQRFSIAHEITHTFFPGYQYKTWCRPNATFRRRDDPDDFVEMLCDIGASELLMPAPWFVEDVMAVNSAVRLLDLVRKYHASREAVLRRFAEIHSKSIAAVFFTWKLKPRQQNMIGRLDQTNIFGTDPAEDVRRSKKLRIDYRIPSTTFKQSGAYLPDDKSVENTGPLYLAASTGRGCEDECELDFGPAAGRFRVIALPHWTPDDELGPNGENAVAAILEPVAIRTPRRKALLPPRPTLF